MGQAARGGMKEQVQISKQMHVHMADLRIALNSTKANERNTDTDMAPPERHRGGWWRYGQGIEPPTLHI